METVLLHSCCAPCSAAIIEWMLAHEIRPVIYYCNPNIFPQGEYFKRKAEITRYCEGLGLEIIDGDWDHREWREAVKGCELAPERGERCQRCFNLRLLKAAQETKELGLARFATTLASSRWKDLEQVHRAGHLAADAVGGVEYWEKNWRKDGLQERRNELIRLNHFYNQNWCGCEFSLSWARQHEKIKKEEVQRLAALASLEARAGK